MTTNKSNAGLVKREETAKTIIKGIKSAHREYEKISDCWLEEGAEYLITVGVAKALWKKFSGHTVVVEGNSDEMREEVGAKRGRTPKSVKNKRYDIILYFKNGGPRAVIEIKGRKDSRAGLLKDVERIMDALKASKVRFGAVGFYYSAEKGEQKLAEEKIKHYVGNLDKEVQKMSNYGAKKWEVNLVKSNITRDDPYAWIAGCITIERGVGNTIK